ncbi:craniofacial development protein 2-like [Neoarius graeffei]|uniref:craniofacial development protein 2-like n=1 Tax=Neoarius graeffei TaxID=443677 RepID=UPI00298C51C6|nr:craniofacial development protein 2-like [Neoarius graeffei]
MESYLDQLSITATRVGAGPPPGRSNDDVSLNPAGRGPSDSSTKNEALMRCRRVLYMATFNACTIRKDSRVSELTHCARLLGIEVLGIHEPRHIHPSELSYTRTEDHFLITSSAWRNEAQAATGGVGFLLSNRAKRALCDICSYSSRILLAVFAGNPATSVIVAYSPTNVSDPADIDQFYRLLRAAVQDTPAHNFLVILGDFNARLGPEDARYPFHQSTNRNSEYLAELLMENNLIASNTSFKKHPGKLWTFEDRATQAKRQLDYILTRKKWRNSVLNCEAYNGFASIGSDHRLVSIRLRLSLWASKQQPKCAHYVWKSLTVSPEIQAQYTIEVKNRFQALEMTEDPTESYQNFIDAIADAAKSCVPLKARVNKPRRSSHPAMVEAREKLDYAIKSQRSSDEIVRARNELYGIYDHLQAADLEEKAARIEAASADCQHSKAWQVINEISGRKKKAEGSRVSGASPEERISTWFTHFRNLLGRVPDIDGEMLSKMSFQILI